MIALRRAILMKANPVVSLHARRLFSGRACSCKKDPCCRHHKQIVFRLCQEKQYCRIDTQFLYGCSVLFYILSARVDICWPCTVQFLGVRKIYSHSERSNLMNQGMLWYITYDRIECGVPFLLYDKFFALVRVTAHGITVRPSKKLLHQTT